MTSPLQRLFADLSKELHALEAQGLRRQIVSLERIDGSCVQIEGRRFVNWCSNDFLGLSQHPELRRAADEAMAAWGAGARAARLLSGTTAWHARLEEALAGWFQAEAAMVFSSGYLANLGTLGALLSSEDLVVMDRLCHASLFDAVRATRATLRVMRHNDPDHLKSLLARRSRARRRIVVTEGVFSMEGDHAPLRALCDVAQARQALLYVDDAHGAFVCGATGRGTPEAAEVPHEALLYMGTLGKALGSQGGFVAGSRVLIDFLRNRARTFLYTTAPAVPVMAAARQALRMTQDMAHRRRRVQELSQRLHARLAAAGLRSAAAAPSHITPVVLGRTRLALEVAQALWEQGIWAPAIRPPTVPEGAARIRVGVTALHTEAQIDDLARVLAICKLET